MKKNFGFTLIELISVITLLSAIILISVPVIINTIKNNEAKLNDDFEKILKQAAELYLERNRELYLSFDEVGDSINIDASTLVDEGYLKQDLEDPVSGDLVSEYKVVVTIGQDEIFDYQLVKE